MEVSASAQSTKLLKLFIIFYSLLGVGPLRPVRPFSSLSTCAHLLWCTIVQSLIIRKFFLFDAFLADAHFKDLQNKPFLKLLLNIDGHWNYSITYLLTLVYYIFTLSKILQRLERHTASVPSSASPSSSFLSTLITFICAISLMTTFFLVSYIAILHEYLRQYSPLEVLFSISILYVNYLVFTLPLTLAHFIQSTTYQAVRSIVAQRNQKTIEQLKESFGLAAAANRDLHRLNSPPMAAFVVSNTVSSLSCICRFSDKPEVNFTTWFFGMLAVQLHLARLSSSTVDQFEVLLREVAKFSCGGQGRRRKRSKSNESESHPKLSSAFQTQSSKQSLYGTYRELCLHKDDFALSIFNILVIDYSFVFSFVLFLLNYCVFMLQTNNI